VSQPPPYSPQHSFISDVTTGTFPGQQLDVEFNDAKTTTDAISANLKLIQRDDGRWPTVSSPMTVCRPMCRQTASHPRTRGGTAYLRTSSHA